MLGAFRSPAVRRGAFVFTASLCWVTAAAAPIVPTGTNACRGVDTPLRGGAVVRCVPTDLEVPSKTADLIVVKILNLERPGGGREDRLGIYDATHSTAPFGTTLPLQPFLTRRAFSPRGTPLDVEISTRIRRGGDLWIEVGRPWNPEGVMVDDRRLSMERAADALNNGTIVHWTGRDLLVDRQDWPGTPSTLLLFDSRLGHPRLPMTTPTIVGIPARWLEDTATTGRGVRLDRPVGAIPIVTRAVPSDTAHHLIVRDVEYALWTDHDGVVAAPVGRSAGKHP